MKKCVLMLLCAAMALGAAPAGAMTLTELRAEAPARLVLTIEGPEGPVAIDAPVVLPEGETLPILRARPRQMDVEAAWRAYYWPDEAEYFVAGGEERGYYGNISATYWADTEMFVPDELGGEANAARVPSLEGPLDGNPLPWEAPDRLMQKMLALLGAGDADVRVAGQVAMSRPYQMEVGRDGPYMTFAAKLDQPIEGREKGYYLTSYTQYLNGAPIFGEVYRHVSFGEGTSHFSPCQLIFGRMLSGEDFDLNISLLEPMDILTEDAALASFGALRQTLEDRVRSGELKDIQSIVLGYQMVYDVTYAEWYPALQEQPSRQRYVLVPCWQVNGYDRKDEIELRNGRVDGNSDLPTALEYAYIRAKSGGAPPLALRIDARTGQVFRGEDFYQSP